MVEAFFIMRSVYLGFLLSVGLRRCVKPNEEKKPLLWVQSKVLIQLHALSIIEALQLRQLGYTYRRQFQVCRGATLAESNSHLHVLPQ